MKKFLFTLATLFMAATAVAQEADAYLYVEDFEVPASVMAETSAKKRAMTVPVKAHFENWVSAMMYTFTPSTDKITVYDCAAGADYGIDYYDKSDNLIENFQPSFGFTQSTGIGIASILLEEGFYYPEGTNPDEDDPVSYGNPKWRGDYTEWAKVTIRFAADFTGGTLDLKSEPSSTPDPRPTVTNEVVSTHTTVITVEQTAQAAPEPAFRVDAGKLYAECADHNVVLMLDGVEVANPYDLPAATYEEQSLHFTAYTLKNDNETANSAEVDTTIVIAAKEKDYAPAPTITETEAGVVAVAPEGYVTVLMLDGNEVAQPYPLPAANYENDQVLHFTAYTKKLNEYYDSEVVSKDITVEKLTKKVANMPLIETEVTSTAVNVTVTPDPNTDGELVYDGQASYPRTQEEYTVTVTAYTKEGATYQKSETAEKTFTVPALDKDVTPDIVINDEVKDEVVTISAAFVQRGEGSLTLKIDDEVTTNPVDMPRLDEDYYVNAYAEGYISDYATKSEASRRILIPKKEQQPQQKADAPAIGVTYGEKGNHAAYVNISTDQENATIYYRLNGGAWMEYTGTLTYTENGSYFVEAYVEIPGKQDSEINSVNFTVSPATGMTDVMSGKTIASQRYFNLAGQEMQEVNGLTIVMTTYTDGTTSAVKVLK